jgi:hypothetical protein
LARHRTKESVALINALVELGVTLGYHSEPEFPVTGSGGAVDVAWCRNVTDQVPLFIFEVETTASSSAANNPLKVFGQMTADFPKPLFFFHVFLSKSENTERINLLQGQYGTQNYRAYRAPFQATELITDVLNQHRRVVETLAIVRLVRGLQTPGWAGVDVHGVLEAVESEGFRACYVPD